MVVGRGHPSLETCVVRDSVGGWLTVPRVRTCPESPSVPTPYSPRGVVLLSLDIKTLIVSSPIIVSSGNISVINITISIIFTVKGT